jgi:hypothetical protein
VKIDHHVVFVILRLDRQTVPTVRSSDLLHYDVILYLHAAHDICKIHYYGSGVLAHTYTEQARGFESPLLSPSVKMSRRTYMSSERIMIRKATA